MGTYLAALTIYRGITGRAPPSLTSLGFTREVEALLQEAAEEAHARYGQAVTAAAAGQ